MKISRRVNSLAVNLALLAAATAAGVGVLEVAARVIVTGRPPGRSGEQAAYTAFDPVLGWRNRPGASVTYNRREYKTRVEINSLGFRDIERTGQILDAFADAVRVDGAIPVVAHIPASFEVVDEDWDHTLMNYGLSAEAWDRSLVRNRMRELSQNSRSHFVDFTDELRASVGGWSGAPYFRHDGHWNDLGNDVAGQALVSFLRRNLLLRCSEPAGPGSSLRTRPRRGDMNASLTAP